MSTEDEIWRNHPYHLIDVSNYGRVKNLWGHVFVQTLRKAATPNGLDYYVRVKDGRQWRFVLTRELFRETWPEYDADALVIQTDGETQIRSDRGYRQKVYCPETGITYRSQREAGEKLELSGPTVSRLVNHGGRSWQGYHLRRV